MEYESMKPKIFIYINSHAAFYINKSNMKKYLNKQIGNKNWLAFSDLIIPEVIKSDKSYITDNFFHGISAHQYTMIYKGGTFINPMLYGLHNDFDLWNDIIHEEPEFFKEVIYIDIPYDVYTMSLVDADEYIVDEEDYHTMSDTISRMVEKIQEVYYYKNGVH